MDIYSCDKCGVVLDRDKLSFCALQEDDGTISEFAIYDGYHYVASASCPICNERVPEG